MMVGSYIDTVINAGQYDGCLGCWLASNCAKPSRNKGSVPSILL